MLRPHGYATITDPLPARGRRSRLEFDTVACRHCSATVHVKPGLGPSVYLVPTSRLTRDVHGRAEPVWEEVPGAWCGMCHGPVCLACHAKGRCLPLERMIEAREQVGRMLAAVAAG